MAQRSVIGYPALRCRHERIDIDYSLAAEAAFAKYVLIKIGHRIVIGTHTRLTAYQLRKPACGGRPCSGCHTRRDYGISPLGAFFSVCEFSTIERMKHRSDKLQKRPCRHDGIGVEHDQISKIAFEFRMNAAELLPFSVLDQLKQGIDCAALAFMPHIYAVRFRKTALPVKIMKNIHSIFSVEPAYEPPCFSKKLRFTTFNLRF